MKQYSVEFGHQRGTMDIEVWDDNERGAIYIATKILVDMVKDAGEFSCNGVKLIHDPSAEEE